jgi:hypothetical protein
MAEVATLLPSPERLQLTACVVDLERRTVKRGSEVAKLTKLEAQLLRFMADRPEVPVTKNELLREVWGYRDGVVTATVATTISRLRRKIEAQSRAPDHLQTVWGGAYLYVPLRPVRQRSEIPLVGTSVGREAERATLAEQVVGGARLVSVVGPAGSGKTHLAVELAWNWRKEGKNVVYVELGSAGTPDDARRAVGAALEVQEGWDEARSHKAIVAALRARGEVLVVLDEVEHLVDAVSAWVASWIACAAVQVVVVSRHELVRVRGQRLRLGPMSPDDGVALFRERFGGDQAGLDDGVIRTIVERVDVLPLAIESAAARAGLVGPAALLEQLGRSGGLREDTTAMDRSWDLLEEHEQHALALLSVFDGSFSLPAAEAVLGSGEEGWRTIERLTGCSLVSFDRSGVDYRLSLYRGVRQYGRERLEELGLRDVAESRMVEWVFAFVDRFPLEPWRWREKDREAADVEHLNLRRASALAESRGALDVAVAIALRAPLRGRPDPADNQALDRIMREAKSLEPRARYFVIRRRAATILGTGASSEGHLLELHAAAAEVGDVTLRSDACSVQVAAHINARRFGEALVAAKESVRLAEQGGDRERLGWALSDLGVAEAETHRHADALPTLHRAVALLGADHVRAKRVGFSIALAQMFDGDLEGAGATVRQGLSNAGSQRLAARFWSLEGHLASIARDGQRALLAYQQSRRNFATSGREFGVAGVTCSMGLLSWLMGDVPGAIGKLEEGVILLRQVSAPGTETMRLVQLGACHAVSDAIERARVVFEEARGLVAERPNLRASEGMALGQLELALARRRIRQGEFTDAMDWVRVVQDRLWAFEQIGVRPINIGARELANLLRQDLMVVQDALAARTTVVGRRETPYHSM